MFFTYVVKAKPMWLFDPKFTPEKIIEESLANDDPNYWGSIVYIIGTYKGYDNDMGLTEYNAFLQKAPIDKKMQYINPDVSTVQFMDFTSDDIIRYEIQLNIDEDGLWKYIKENCH